MGAFTQTAAGPITNNGPKDLVRILQSEGYDFRLSILDDTLEIHTQGIGWVRATDPLMAKIRTRLRELDLGRRINEAIDAIWEHAHDHPYHPVKEYLDTLQYDGGNYIDEFASYVTDKNGVFPVYLRKWLIHACARVYTGIQGSMLVLEGEQGIGKSDLCKWLAPSPLLYTDGPINPDDKDHRARAASTWIWEVSELGSTTNRADVDALKDFLTTERFKWRPPYAKFDVIKSALACWLGTVNNSTGFLNDPTGSRRFWVTTITRIDWDYTKLNRDLIWAEAHAAYLAGEAFRLTKAETVKSSEINEDYAPESAIENAMVRLYHIDPAQTTWWVASADILNELQIMGLVNAGNADSVARKTAAFLRKQKCIAYKQHGDRGWQGLMKK